MSNESIDEAAEEIEKRISTKARASMAQILADDMAELSTEEADRLRAAATEGFTLGLQAGLRVMVQPVAARRDGSPDGTD